MPVSESFGDRVYQVVIKRNGEEVKRHTRMSRLEADEFSKTFNGCSDRSPWTADVERES